MVLNENSKTFDTYVTSLALISIYSDRKGHITSLLIEKVKIQDEYLDFVDIFSEEKALVLLEQAKFNQYAIELEKGK